MSDLISRQAAIDALCNDYCGGHQDCKHYPKCENLKSIQKLPSAQLEIINRGRQMTIEKALATSLWYNDLLCVVESWADLQPNEYGQITMSHFDADIDPIFKAQLRFVWMILVIMYGDFGTSPRFGWIEDINGFRAFIERLKEFDLGGDNECDW